MGEVNLPVDSVCVRAWARGRATYLCVCVCVCVCTISQSYSCMYVYNICALQVRERETLCACVYAYVCVSHTQISKCLPMIGFMLIWGVEIVNCPPHVCRCVKICSLELRCQACHVSYMFNHMHTCDTHRHTHTQRHVRTHVQICTHGFMCVCETA